MKRAEQSCWKGNDRHHIKKAIDRFWSGVWWTEWRLLRNEKRLALALEHCGEDSIPVRRLTERHRTLAKGVKYWRSSDPVVVSVLEASEQAGACRSDLRVLALNRDIYRVRNNVYVRRAWISIALAWSAVGIVLGSWFMLTALFVLSPTNLVTRLTGATAVTAFYWFTWQGFSLFSTRALAAAARARETVERVAKHHEVRSASITTIRAGRNEKSAQNALLKATTLQTHFVADPFPAPAPPARQLTALFERFDKPEGKL